MELVIKSVGFVHLHVHSAYSLREGALTIETLAKLAKADDMPALAITDTNNLFGALEFSEKLAKSGMQPIIGAQLTVDFGDAAGFGRLAEPRAGRAASCCSRRTSPAIANLMRLVCRVWLDPTDGDEPHVALRRRSGDVAGLIALTGGAGGPIDRAAGAGACPTSPRRG